MGWPDSKCPRCGKELTRRFSHPCPVSERKEQIGWLCWRCDKIYNEFLELEEAKP